MDLSTEESVHFGIVGYVFFLGSSIIQLPYNYILKRKPLSFVWDSIQDLLFQILSKYRVYILV